MAHADELTGCWAGHYVQHGRPHPIEADLAQEGGVLLGRMRDGETDQECSLFELAARAGLPPGADEQLADALKGLVPGAPPGPVRYVTHLPPESLLEGRVDGPAVSFLKRYQGTHYGGFRVGDRLVGDAFPAHTVHYEGRLSPDGAELEGWWWIDPPPGSVARRAEGTFRLCRQAAGAAPPGEAAGPAAGA
jgi:hypothetical protein